MQLVLIKQKEIYSYILPEKVSGQYWVAHINEDSVEEKLIGVEGIGEQWIIRAGNNVTMEGKGTAIEEGKIYNIHIKSIKENALLYIEPVTDDRKNFEKLLLPDGKPISIGRSKECSICIAKELVSSEHAKLIVKNDEVIIMDNSSNGTYVNNVRIDDKVLEPGDVVYIIGFKLIYVGQGIIAINNPDGKITYDKRIFKKYIPDPIHEVDDEEIDDNDDNKNLFYRSPRFRKDIKKQEIVIDSPTAKETIQDMPLILMLGPSLTMALTSLVTVIFTIQNNLANKGNIKVVIPSLAMAFSMLLGAILWPILTKNYEKKRRNKKEAIRQEKYKMYINKIRDDIEKESALQAQVLFENNVTIDECGDRISLTKRNLWERTYEQNDFLNVRLGIGNVPLSLDLKYQEKRFEIEEDNLKDELYKLIEEPRILKDVPVVLSLKESNISGIIGERKKVIELVKSMIVQLTALHSYDELKLIFIYDKRENEIWNFAKWLPHVWSDDKDFRFIATNSNEFKELSVVMEKEILRREQINSEEGIKSINPYYIIFSMDKHISEKSGLINSVLKQKRNYGFSLVALYDELKNLPKECLTVIDVGDSTSKIYDKNDISGEYKSFKAETKTNYHIEDLAKNLANIELNTSSSNKLPNMITFLEMYKVGKIEHLNLLTRWKENDPTLSLEAPIGVGTTGDVFKLDLHEKFHGPHGLVAGMTGSGKSEFIMTFITSLALNYHPHEVSFILIDYKGGGMATAFKDLPHLAGVITNLDGSSINRSLISIQSELTRRQAIFKSVGEALEISNIDIYQYQKFYREGKFKEPIQHLFIISDEFAELKTQQPDFMHQLVSAARIGRSLGIHLILATQKPAGVVDDQIWSNSKFRVCLKVQEKADSMDVIKRPDAAELKETGRFYLQVGYNEFFDIGQSAWGGAPYIPSDGFEKKQDNNIVVIDTLGRILKQIKTEEKKDMKILSKQEKNKKQVDEIIKYISTLAKEENLKSRPLWMEALKEEINLQYLNNKYGKKLVQTGIINPVIGEIDDPEKQSQYIMTLPITQEGNTAIYGIAESGKTMLLTTMIYSIIANHSSREVNLYILDFEGRTLQSFSKAPHVGDVIFAEDEEKVENLFKVLKKELENRKKIFADYGGDYIRYVKESGDYKEAIIVIIHNYSVFEEEFERRQDELSYIAREGNKCGIYFVITAADVKAIRSKILRHFKQIYAMQLKDSYDYLDVIENARNISLPKVKGRGIFGRNKKIYEFQIANVCGEEENTLGFIEKACLDCMKKEDGVTPKVIPAVNRRIDVEYLKPYLNSNSNKIPVGIEKDSLDIAYYDFSSSYINLVVGKSINKSFVQGLAEVIAANKHSEVIVFDPNKAFYEDINRGYEYVKEGFEDKIVELYELSLKRHKLIKEFKEKEDTSTNFKKKTYIINSLSSLESVLTRDKRSMLNALLQRGETKWGIEYILVEEYKELFSYVSEKWYKVQVTGDDVIWVGKGINEQAKFEILNNEEFLLNDIEEKLGYCISKRKPTLIKLLTTHIEDMEGK